MGEFFGRNVHIYILHKENKAHFRTIIIFVFISMTIIIKNKHIVIQLISIN